jgi:carbonic anhydrase/acetyltransferase-like protein (isoleucine patch superfamily)
MTAFHLGELAPTLPAEGEYWIAPSASVIGRVEVGPDASIWYGAVLRADTDRIVIGRGTNIQDGSVIHADPGSPTIIGEGVTVGHMVMLHGCSVGENSLIGIGAVVLNRVRIGRNCLIGARSLITEGKEIPDGSLVMGSPARVVRPLTEAEIAGLRDSAAHYVAAWKRHARDLRPI